MKGWYEDEINYDLFFLSSYHAKRAPGPFTVLKIEDGIFTMVWHAPLKYEWILGKKFYCLFSTILFASPSWHETIKKLFSVWKLFPSCNLNFFVCAFIIILNMHENADYLSDYANENSFYGWRFFFYVFQFEKEGKNFRFCFFFAVILMRQIG